MILLLNFCLFTFTFYLVFVASPLLCVTNFARTRFARILVSPEVTNTQ